MEEMEPLKVNLIGFIEKFVAIPVGPVVVSGVPLVHTCWTWAFTIIRSYQLTCEFEKYRKNPGRSQWYEITFGFSTLKKGG